MSSRRPVPSSPSHVWAIAQPGKTLLRDHELTGIHHADLDCPALREWTGADAEAGSVLWEIDPVTGGAWDWLKDDEGWDQPSYSGSGGETMNLAEWRPCLRCGSVSGERTPTVCPRCWLTPCDCE